MDLYLIHGLDFVVPFKVRFLEMFEFPLEFFKLPCDSFVLGCQKFVLIFECLIGFLIFLPKVS